MQHAAVTGEWLVWAEFAERGWRDLTRAPQRAETAAHIANWGKANERVLGEMEARRLSWHGGISAPTNFFTDTVTAINAKFGGCMPISPEICIMLAREEAALRDYEAKAQANAAYLEEYKQRMAAVRVELPWEPVRRTVVKDSIGMWRKSRKHVLSELETLRLAATVERTEGSVPLEEHEADLAGLVRFHSPNNSGALLPKIEQGDHADAYIQRMLDAHGLIAHGGLPRTLRGFCGQHEPDEHRPGWLDHAFTWLDRNSEPVLTIEPYRFDPADVVKALNGLPLRADVHPGVWHTQTTLLALRWDPDAWTLPAEHSTTELAVAA